MPFVFQIIDGGRGVLSVGAGTVVFDDLKEQGLGLNALIAPLPPEQHPRYALADLSAVESVQLSLPELMTMQDISARNAALVPDLFLAIVATRDDHLVFATQWQVAMNRLSWKSAIFATRSLAEGWGQQRLQAQAQSQSPAACGPDERTTNRE